VFRNRQFLALRPGEGHAANAVVPNTRAISPPRILHRLIARTTHATRRRSHLRWQRFEQIPGSDRAAALLCKSLLGEEVLPLVAANLAAA
jgi:hypothetical protein